MSNFITLDDLFVPFWDEIKDRKIFCGFKIMGEQKMPVGVDGQTGLGADASIERFGTYEQIKQMMIQSEFQFGTGSGCQAGFCTD